MKDWHYNAHEPWYSDKGITLDYFKLWHYFEVTGWHHSLSALSQGNEALVLTEHEVEQAPELVWMQWQREKSPVQPENYPLFSGLPSHSLVTMIIIQCEM
jgi:hypothetical protein